MIAHELEVVLHHAFVDAREKRHQFITSEHLLLAVIDSTSAAPMLAACGANVRELRNALAQHIAKLNPPDTGGREIDTQPTMEFQRVIQRAILKVQSSGKKEVGSLDVLLALIAETKSRAAQLLEEHSVTYQAVVSRMDEASGPLRQDLPGSRFPDSPAPASGVIGQELEVGLHMAFVDARQKRHEFITVEHLLRSLLENPSAAEVLRACGAHMDELRKNLTRHIEEGSPVVAPDRDVDTQPTLGFQRVLQRAILRVQSSGREVAGADVLVAIFGEKDSHAVRFLLQYGVTRLRVATYISHGVTSQAPPVELGDAKEVQVVLYNDDFTPMQFVVDVLQTFFGMDEEDAKDAMLEIHREGKAVCGLYTREDGETLVRQVLEFACENGHPLCCEAVVPK